MKFFADTKVYKYILKMALPAIAGLSTQMVVSLVDTAMVGRLPEAKYSLAAMGIGVLATWAIISFFSSLATGTHVVVARRFGEKNYEECGDALNTSLIISFTMGALLSVFVILFAWEVAGVFAAEPKVAQLAGDYLHFRFMGIPFFLLTISYRGFYFGIGKTKIFMFSGAMANLLNIFFNYIFIYGAFGFEGMGLAGAGLGSTFATICDALFYLAVSALPRYRNKFKNFVHFRFIKEVANKILRISLPVSFQNIFILVGFLSFIRIVGWIGTLEQAATQAIINSLFITIMPCFGFGIAIQTLVGNSLGAKKVQLAKFYGYETSKIATAYTVFVGIVFLIVPRAILGLATDDSTIIEIAVPALRVVGVGQVFYGVAFVLANGLQAAGKTFFVMMAEVAIVLAVFLPLAYLFGVYLDYGLVGAWSALPVYVFLYALVIYLRFRLGDWKKLKQV